MVAKKRKKGSKKKAVSKTRRRKRAVGKSGKKTAKPKRKAAVIGVVTHYFSNVQAAVVKLKKPLALGDAIHIQGSTTDFQQQVESMQIDRVPIQKAKKGDEIGLQVKERVREHDLILPTS